MVAEEIVISGIPQTVTQRKMLQFVTSFGEIVAYLSLMANNNRDCYFVFVKYKFQQSAIAVTEKSNELKLDDARITIGFLKDSQHSSEQSRSSTTLAEAKKKRLNVPLEVVLENIHSTVPESKIIQFITSFGEIVRYIRPFFDHNGHGRGYVFVKYRNQQSAAAAVNSSNQLKLGDEHNKSLISVSFLKDTTQYDSDLTKKEANFQKDKIRRFRHVDGWIAQKKSHKERNRPSTSKTHSSLGSSKKSQPKHRSRSRSPSRSDRRRRRYSSSSTTD